MRDLIKRVLTVVCAVGVISVYTGIAASATGATIRPMPGTASSAESSAAVNDNQDGAQAEGSSGVSAIDETRTRSAGNYVASSENGASDDESDETQQSDPEQDNSVQAAPPTIVPVSAGDYNEAAPQTPQEEAPKSERGYVTMGGMFLWFLLALIVNAVVSFWVGNRFYKLAKKDTHVTTEIRALRRDVEEKFISNVGGFTEMENEVSNSNDDYSMNGEGIKMPERKARETQNPVVADGFEEDAFRQWESRQAEVQASREQAANNRQSVEQTQRISTSRARREETERAPRKKQYQPKREESYEPSDDDLQDNETKTEKKTNQSLNSVKNKAKEFLGDIFPFKED